MSARIDWQAYLDDSLAEDQKREADVRLAHDPSARKEVESLRSFVSQVRTAARSEPVPLGRFDACLPKRSGNPVVRRSIFALAPVVVFALAWFVMRGDPMRLDTPPVRGTMDVADPGLAAKWSTENLGRPVPTLSLSGIGHMTAARYGDHWASYDYLVGTDHYGLTVSFASPNFTESPVQNVDGYILYQAQGTGWIQKGMSFYLTGPRQDVRTALACAVIREVGRQNLPNRLSSATSCHTEPPKG